MYNGRLSSTVNCENLYTLSNLFGATWARDRPTKSTVLPAHLLRFETE